MNSCIFHQTFPVETTAPPTFNAIPTDSNKARHRLLSTRECFVFWTFLITKDVPMPDRQVAAKLSPYFCWSHSFDIKGEPMTTRKGLPRRYTYTHNEAWGAHFPPPTVWATNYFKHTQLCNFLGFFLFFYFYFYFFFFLVGVSLSVSFVFLFLFIYFFSL